MTHQLIATRDEAAAVSAALARTERLAVDTEFLPERRRVPDLQVVSIGTAQGVWVFDATVPRLVEALDVALRGKTWVVHGGRHDIALLVPLVGSPKAVVDTQVLAGLTTPAYPSRLDQLLTGEPSTRLVGETMSDWSRRPLTQAQVDYAAGDVQPLLKLAERLEARARSLARLDVFREVMDEHLFRASGVAHTDPHAIRGRDHLAPREAAALDELVWWRDQRADELDIAPSSVLSDGHLLDLAKRSPLSIAAVGANRRFPARLAERYGEAIVEIILRVHRRPESMLPTTAPPGSRREARRAWWRAEALLEGRRQGWSASLVLPDSVLWPLADGGGLDGWRIRLAGAWADESRSRVPAALREPSG